MSLRVLKHLYETGFTRHKDQDICVIHVQKHNFVHTESQQVCTVMFSETDMKTRTKGTKLLKVNARTHTHIMLEVFPLAQILTSVRSKEGFFPQKLYLLTWLKYELHKLFTKELIGF